MTLKTYNQAIDTLLDAYNRGELFHGKCNACAVGTLLGTNQWRWLFETTDTGRQFTYNSFRDWVGIRFVTLTETQYTKEASVALNVIERSEFTIEELKKIELAFEASIALSEEGYDFWIMDQNKKQGQYIGLTAVLDVMSTMVDEEVNTDSDQKRLKDIYELRSKEVKTCVVID